MTGQDDVAAAPKASGDMPSSWLKGDMAVWRGRLVEVQADSGQLPVRLMNGDVVMAWADQLRTVSAEGKERSDHE